MVYIQSNSERTLPHHFDAASAMYGAIESAMDFRLTSFEEVESGKFDNLIRTNLFVGSVEFMREVFKRVNKTPQAIRNSDRNHIRVPLSYVRERIEMGESYFVKPFQQKLFSGLVVDKYSISSLREFADDLEVMVYGVLPKIVSEWRTYICYNKIEDCKNYCGSFKHFPNFEFIESKIQEFKKDLPVSYVMDIGICEDNNVFIYDNGERHMFYNNVVIEFNDMYAIGNYGVPNDLYLRMLRHRYFEIMNTYHDNN